MQRRSCKLEPLTSSIFLQVGRNRSQLFAPMLPVLAVASTRADHIGSRRCHRFSPFPSTRADPIESRRCFRFSPLPSTRADATGSLHSNLLAPITSARAVQISPHQLHRFAPIKSSCADHIGFLTITSVSADHVVRRRSLLLSPTTSPRAFRFRFFLGRVLAPISSIGVDHVGSGQSRHLAPIISDGASHIS
jgi:hypothetical protein